MHDILIIGCGPGGISAAVYALRSGLRVQIVAKGKGALEKADKIENYYGFGAPVSGETLIKQGLEQAVRLGAHLAEDEIVSVGYNGNFTASGLKADYEAKAVVLATGAARAAAPVKGLQKLEGAGVSYCAICDAFFYRGKDVVVIGDGEYALHEAADLLPVAASVTLLTNGKPAPAQVPDVLRVDTRKIEAATGEERVEGIQFADGTHMPVHGVFIALGVAGSDALARKLGALTKGNQVLVNEDMATNVPGLFAAGDCTGGLKQIVKAAHEGAVAGLAAVKFVRGREK